MNELPTNKSKKPSYTYFAELERVIDGDTYILKVDLGFGVHFVVHVRVRGINTAEIYGVEKEEGLLVAEYVRGMFEKAEEIVVETQYIRSFKRYQADIYLDGENLANHLLVKGMAEINE